MQSARFDASAFIGHTVAEFDVALKLHLSGRLYEVPSQKTDVAAASSRTASLAAFGAKTAATQSEQLEGRFPITITTDHYVLRELIFHKLIVMCGQFDYTAAYVLFAAPEARVGDICASLSMRQEDAECAVCMADENSSALSLYTTLASLDQASGLRIRAASCFKSSELEQKCGFQSERVELKCWVEDLQDDGELLAQFYIIDRERTGYVTSNGFRAAMRAFVEGAGEEMTEAEMQQSCDEELANMASFYDEATDTVAYERLIAVWDDTAASRTEILV